MNDPVTETEIQAKPDEYQQKFRKLIEPSLMLSDRCDIKNDQEANQLSWPAEYPNAKRPGIYVVMDSERHVLYIGKASWGSTIGSRLGSYFCGRYDEGAKVRHQWTRRPRYIATAAVSPDHPFEAASLEEFLITGFRGRLTNNAVGSKD